MHKAIRGMGLRNQRRMSYTPSGGSRSPRATHKESLQVFTSAQLKGLLKVNSVILLIARGKVLFVKLPQCFMRVLIPDDRRGQRGFLRQLVQREREVQVSGVPEEAESTPDNVIACELRRALDGCPICDRGYRDHSYMILAIVAIQPHWQSLLCVKQYFDLLQKRRWQELLCLREWNAEADTLVGFAFRCDMGRVGIVTLLSPAKPDLPDTPLHYTILSEDEGKILLASLPAEKWLPLRSGPPAGN